MKAKRLLMMLFTVGVFLNSQGQTFGIGTDSPDPSAILDVTGIDKGVLIPRISINNASASAPVIAPAVSLLVYNTNASILNAKGTGYYYWTGIKWQPLVDYPVADNGITYFTATNEFKLGGVLLEDTKITLDNYDFRFDVDNNGEFILEENGNTKFRLHDNGNISIGGNDEQGDFNVTGTSYFSDDIRLRDGDVTSGDNLVRLTSQSDDGIIRVYENDDINHEIHGRNETVFNEQGLNSADVRFESDNRNEAMLVDAQDDVVRFGDNNGSLSGNGNVIIDFLGDPQATIDYVADFDNGLTTGTTIGMGSVEFFTDGNNEILTSAMFSPATELNIDLGWANSFDDVYADNFVNISDLRAKKDIKNIGYGLKELLNMRPVSYVLKADPFKETKLGLIAQETLPLVPEVVKTHDFHKLTEGGEYEQIEMKLMRMTYIQLIPVIIKGIQEQQESIEKLKKEHTTSVEMLQKQIDDLKAANQIMMDRLNEIAND